MDFAALLDPILKQYGLAGVIIIFLFWRNTKLQEGWLADIRKCVETIGENTKATDKLSAAVDGLDESVKEQIRVVRTAQETSSGNREAIATLTANAETNRNSLKTVLDKISSLERRRAP